MKMEMNYLKQLLVKNVVVNRKREINHIIRLMVEKTENFMMRIKKIAINEKNMIFRGRFRGYKYYDMEQVIDDSLKLVEEEFYR